MAQYRGGKNAAGTYQKIINSIPPHNIYIECFLGSGAILRLKRPAEISIGVEIDPDIVKWWGDDYPEWSGSVILGEAMHYLTTWANNWPASTKVFVYADPPYLGETRSRQNIYTYEFNTPEQHTDLLATLMALPENWMVALSGYRSKLYDKTLKGWRRLDFDVVTHQGTMKTESLYMNYDEPTELHDYRYLGDNYREREVIAKRKRRWIARLQRMDRMERYAMLDAIQEFDRTSTKA